jgi:DNA-binding NtrC family response regulator
VDALRRGVTLALEEGEAVRGPLRLRLDDGREVALDRRMVIGSAPGSDLLVDDPRVSGWHCVVWRDGQRTMVSDFGSRNGTFLRGVRVQSGELRAGMPLTVGSTRMRVVLDEPRAEAPADGMLGHSRAIGELRRRLGRVARAAHPVLLLGESGTGKELAARIVHARSGRRGAFVPLNCGAMSPELVESLLFGHERGAFTGATGRRQGMFEEADGGTLFLDEIGELPLALQPKLLRALETGTVRSVGGSGERRVDVRVVAATHRDLPRAVDEGSFRLDLYHRLCALQVRLPSLRERADDIPLLARHFLDEATADSSPRRLSAAAVEALVRHPWPGNVRELRNAICRAVVLGGEVLEPEDLLPSDGPAPWPAGPRSTAAPPAGRRLDEVQRALIAGALREHNGNRRAAAASLGIPKSTLCDRVRRYGLQPD